MEGDCTETRNQRGASQLFKVYKVVELDAIRWTTSVVDVRFLSRACCTWSRVAWAVARARCALRSRVASRYSHTHYVTMSDLRLYTYYSYRIYTTRISNTLITHATTDVR